MRICLRVRSDRAPRRDGEPTVYVAWAELGGVPVTGVLARHGDRRVSEMHARLALAAAIRGVLEPVDGR